MSGEQFIKNVIFTTYKGQSSTGNIMLYVVIALLPASAFGVWNFGFPALIMLISNKGTAVLTEYIYEKLMHKRLPLTIGVHRYWTFAWT